MVRNIILLVSTLAILGLLFAGYVVLVDDPAVDERRTRSAIDALPTATDTGASNALKIGDALEIPPGEGVEFTVYDERTGQPTERFECDEWTPVRGAKNEVFVTLPKLTIWLPSGMMLAISAAEGQITVDRVERVQGRPKLGELRGDVRLVFDRGTDRDRPPLSARPQDAVTVALDRLRFDLELGELHTDGRIDITAADFEIAGTGFDLVWNQADNQIESLLLREGERLVLYGANGLFRTTGEATPPATAEPATTTGPATPAQARPRRHKPKRGVNAYECVLTGGIVAEQFDGEQHVGGLTADEVRLLFDVGGAANRFMGQPTASAPASRPTAEQRERLVVHWSGPLRLGPTPGAAAPDRPRRHFEAAGTPTTMTHADGEIRCGRVEYWDETQQIWLHPGADGRVHFSMGRGLSAAADDIYIDRGDNLVKLIGDVDLLTLRGEGENVRQRSIRCTLWAALRVAAAADSTPTTQPGGELISYGRLEAATFVGDARVDLGDQRLTAHRVDATFKPADDQESFDAALDTAIATGSVRLGREDEALECEKLELAFGVGDDGELYPRRMNAYGSVLISRDRSWVRGDHVRAELRPRPTDAEPGGPVFVLSTLDIMGHAELRDPRNKVAARADHISAVFKDRNRLMSATIHGTADHFGLVHAAPYTVGGERIDLAWDRQTLHVDGPSRLKFKARRSLQGHRRQQPTPVSVTCEQSLHIDGLRNTIHFAGNVAAESSEEKLIGDTLTLLLEDVEEPEDSTPERLKPGDLLRAARELLSPLRAGQPQRDPLELGSDEVGRMHKEPVRLLAENALIQSETYEPGNDQPVVHSSIDAPLLEVDIVHREIMTRGQTTLLVTNRRLHTDERAAREVLGIPSALVARGPSQTALRCYGSMTYVLGREDPTRRDSVLFEGGVEFVRCTGLEMANIEEMLPQVRTNPELVSNLESRNTALTCDRLECGFLVGDAGRAGEPAPASGRGGMRFTWLLASGNTYLRDVHGPVIREVNAHQIDFDRTISLIRVLGAPRYDARIYEENSETQESRILVGEEFTINLQSNTIRTGATRGEFRNP